MTDEHTSPGQSRREFLECIAWAGTGAMWMAAGGVLRGVEQAASPTTAVHVVEMVASRGRYEPSTVEVIEGEPVKLVIRSRDVAHGFSVPRLKIERQVPAGGEPVVIEFAAPAPGRFVIRCSEFCGRGHEAMRAVIISRAAATGR